MRRCLTLVLILTGLYAGIAAAGINDGMVEWLAKDARFAGLRQLEFRPVIDATGQTFDIDAAAVASRAMRQRLESAGMRLADPGSLPQPAVVLTSSLLHYEPGSVGGRWIGFGGGAAICILRSQLVDGASGRLLGDFVASYQVQVGGLFSVGAHEQVPRAAGRLVAERILKLVGLPGGGDETE